MTDYTLSPCPYCSRDEAVLEHYGINGLSYVACPCGVTGPSYDEVDATWTGDEKQAAADGWNRLWILVHKAPQALDWMRARKDVKEEVRQLEYMRKQA